MVDTPGFCSRMDACGIAASRVPIRVPLASAFICPECGGHRTPPTLGEIVPLAGKPALAIFAWSFVAIFAGVTFLAHAGLFGRHTSPPAPAVVPTEVTPSAIKLKNSAPTIVEETLAPVPPAIIPAPLPVLGTASLQHALHAHVSYVPPNRSDARRNALMHHHADVHLSLSIPLIAGGQPDYPEQYQDGQSGHVRVLCGLRSNGLPHDCTTIRRSGGPLFDVAVHTWLDLRDVRFKPARLRGRILDHVMLNVDFIGEASPS